MYRQIKKVLYATDLSEPAREAMKYALNMALNYDASISAIHVIPDIFEELSMNTGVEMELYFGFDRWKDIEINRFDNARKSIEERINSIQKEMAFATGEDFPVFFDTVVKVGDPVKEIIRLSREGEYDAIVMATHGRGYLKEFLVGSVSRGVLKKSKVPVFLVPVDQKTKN